MAASDLAVNPAVAPVQQAERIQIVDILRGFALFGILLVNMAIFSRYLQDIARANEVYPDGNFLEITAQRVYDYGSMGLTSFFYGLGLFGTMGSAAGIVLTAVIFLILIPFSHWWMKSFLYGPFEWLWRSMTYLKAQPMRRLS